MVTLIVIAEHSKERRLAKYYPGKWLSATHKLGLSAVLYNVFSNNKSTVIITITNIIKSDWLSAWSTALISALIGQYMLGLSN